ncbi:MAG TPA: Uma2 family endonuclease [Archangium sp.]|uniref:Uma2 family endonuclease n=1 Tax=Archangium sp. TaxID=1872627 RepID=UPI002E382276|nr:Uma2 family endonuclease [Archangium sp.]HEX5753300.1 Uma2 family endonuclease [Archangium sp.]
MERDRRGNAEAFPRAPSQQEWEAMSVEEREQVVDSLPGEVTWDEMAMPEGDRHLRAKVSALDVLEAHFSRHRRHKVYLGAELPVYYPGERRFAPDLLAVRDVERHERDKWVVSAEGKGLDWVMEVHVGGDRKKDAEYNVRRYARLGIPEYFIYDRKKERLVAYRLPASGPRKYAPIPLERGRYHSEQLGLDLQVEEGRLRFWAGRTPLLESDERIARLKKEARLLRQRAAEEAQRAAEESRRVAEESRRRETAEQQLAKLRTELKRLRTRSS